MYQIKEKCDCDMENTCKSAQGKCINVPIGRHHLLCDRPLCDKCIFIRKYHYLCYKLIFKEEPLRLEAHLKNITKLFHEYKIQLYLKNVQKYAYCFHSEEFQNHRPVMVFPPHFFLMYEFDDARNLTNEVIEGIRNIVDKELGGEYIEGGEHFRREFTENLISAYKVVLTCIRIENGEGKMFIRNEDLLAMNNIITSCSNWKLRKV